MFCWHVHRDGSCGFKGFATHRSMELIAKSDYEWAVVCGASSKDAGAKITAIVEDYGTAKYKPMIDSLLQNPQLVLPQ